ncbi:YeeE/YedE thiosulfate transporter family protein [Thalassoroseus pseudoceratinae]|uniref:YeeE/YedE thiosulfate transporter family protein n=1 Tax=Thalassoroseus pseudoceratinae TaxID=2713176 RepID=UPI001F0E45D8|nr:YeeE/YedE thiosulfate transporter family protein [Thalassoroseus pseudoceratinae]
MKNMISTLLFITSVALPLQVAQAAEELPSPYPYPQPTWSPYLVGALIGVLVLLTLSLANKKIGASSAYSDLAGLLGRVIAPRHIRSLPYWQDKKPMISWTLLIVLGAIGGSWLAASTGTNELTGTYLQDMWLARFGPDSFGLRTIVAFVGGTVMAYGARLAGGCTSGHGISGTLQLAVGSWIAVVCFFIGGIATAMLMYRL